MMRTLVLGWLPVLALAQASRSTIQLGEGVACRNYNGYSNTSQAVLHNCSLVQGRLEAGVRNHADDADGMPLEPVEAIPANTSNLRTLRLHQQPD